MTNTTIRSNSDSAIVVQPSTGATRITATIDNVWLQGNGNSGLIVLAGSLAMISNSIISGNTSFGVLAEGSAGPSECHIETSVIAHNGTGVTVAVGSPIVRLSSSTVINIQRFATQLIGSTRSGRLLDTINFHEKRCIVGISVINGGVATFSNNRIAANGSGNAPSPGTTIPLL